MNKICGCAEKNANYNDFGGGGTLIKCQYCMGVNSDLKDVRAYIAFNTPTNIENRDKEIATRLQEHKEALNAIRVRIIREANEKEKTRNWKF